MLNIVISHIVKITTGFSGPLAPSASLAHFQVTFLRFSPFVAHTDKLDPAKKMAARARERSADR